MVHGSKEVIFGVITAHADDDIGLTDEDDVEDGAFIPIVMGTEGESCERVGGGGRGGVERGVGGGRKSERREEKSPSARSRSLSPLDRSCDRHGE